jgi:hypothetical protein
MICDLNNINEIIKKEGLNLLVVSYGGSSSNIFIHYLEKNNYKCRTATWEKILCHCPEYIEVDIPIIYIYDNPINAFISMRNKGNGIWNVNQKKLSNNNNITLSDENLINLMICQFNSWTSQKRDNVLIIKSSEIFEEEIVDKLENFLNKKINHFPILFKTPKSNQFMSLITLFTNNKLELDNIINYV